jgi:hypothetical protein
MEEIRPIGPRLTTPTLRVQPSLYTQIVRWRTLCAPPKTARAKARPSLGRACRVFVLNNPA